MARQATALVLLALAAGLTRPAAAARLEVGSEPAGATVFLDDRFIGTTPLQVDVDGEGRHLLRLERRGQAVWRSAIELGAEPVRVTAQLQPEALGKLSVTTQPGGADVYVDGQLEGKAPLSLQGLALGHHTVQLVEAGCEPHFEEVVLSAQAPEATLDTALTPRIADYLIAHLATHSEDVMAVADLAHEYALQNRFDECLEVLGKGFDAVAEHGEALDQDAIRRLYMEVERLDEKQYDYAPDEVVAALQPRLVEALRAAIERAPANGYNYECLALLLTRHGDTVGALEAYGSGAQAADALPVRIRLQGEAGSILYAAGTTAAQAQNWPAAVEAYERVVTEFPELWCAANALARLADVYAQGLNDPAKSLDAARRLVERFPQDPSGAVALARAAKAVEDAGQVEQAAALYQEAGERYPKVAAATGYLVKAATLYETPLKQPDKALAALRKLIDIAGPGEGGADAQFRAAKLLQAQGDQAGADALIQEILTSYPLSREAMLAVRDERGRAAYRDAARAYQQAAKVLKEEGAAAGAAALEAMIEALGDHYYSCVAQQMIANAWTKEQDYEKAVAAHQRFAERWPDHPDASQQLYRAATVLYSNVGDPIRAIAAYERVVEAYPTTQYAEQALYQLGQIRMENAAVINYQSAMDSFLRLAREFPDSENAAASRKYAGDCLMMLRDPEGARAIFMELMTEDPNSYVAYLAASRGYQWVRMRKDEDSTP